MSKRRLADARWTHEAQNGPFHIALQLADRQVLDDALFDLVEIVVILVEDAAGLDGIEPIGGRDAPRNLEQPIHVHPDHLVLG